MLLKDKVSKVLGFLIFKATVTLYKNGGQCGGMIIFCHETRMSLVTLVEKFFVATERKKKRKIKKERKKERKKKERKTAEIKEKKK